MLQYLTFQAIELLRSWTTASEDGNDSQATWLNHKPAWRGGQRHVLSTTKLKTPPSPRPDIRLLSVSCPPPLVRTPIPDVHYGFPKNHLTPTRGETGIVDVVTTWCPCLFLPVSSDASRWRRSVRSFNTAFQSLMPAFRLQSSEEAPCCAGFPLGRGYLGTLALAQACSKLKRHRTFRMKAAGLR